MPSSKNSLPKIEAAVPLPLLTQFEETIDFICALKPYHPDWTAEDALKSLAYRHGMKAAVAHLRSVYESQQKEKADGRSDQPRSGDRWPPAGQPR